MNEERKVINLNIDDILPNRFQPRIKFNENAINELAESIKLHGVIQPIVVRKISDKYEIIAGERRYKASVMAGKTTIPAIVTSLDDKNSAEVALIENVQRQDLTPIEEAISYKKILDMGYISQEALGSKLGKKQSTIANKLRLLNLNDEVQEALMENKISERHARSLLKLKDNDQVLMLNRIINERLTVRKTDEEIAKLLENNSDSDSQKEIEKGENTMNNDILKDFNIPSEPIINDNDGLVFEDEKEEQANTDSNMNIEIPTFNEFETMNNQAVSQEPVNNQTINQEPIVHIFNQEPVINPGFMDIDKIQNEAQDIIKEPTPVANMDDLLKPDENIVSPIQEVAQPLPKEEDNVPQGGKFFNMFNFNEPEKNASFVENVEDEQVNMDFGEKTYTNNFVNPIPVDVPTEEVKPVVEPVQPVQPVQPEFPTPAPAESVQPNVTSEVPTFDEVPLYKPIKEEQPSNDIPFENQVQSFSLTDEDEFKEVEPVVPQFNQTINEPINKSYMMNDDFKFDEDGEIEVKLPSQEPATTVDMKTVINTIRECAKKIESFGYKIDTDEIDLADSYEVTFKIEKNN